MANSRQPKWDWQTHLPGMIELYKSRLSIPDICDAIQCEGFTPCLSSVYSKFRSEGYPTDQNGRMKFLDAMSPAGQQTSDIMTRNDILDIAPHNPGSSQSSRPDPSIVPGVNDYPTPESLMTGNNIPAFGDIVRRKEQNIGLSSPGNHTQVQVRDDTSTLSGQRSCSNRIPDDESEPTTPQRKKTRSSKQEKQELESEKVLANLTRLGILCDPKRTSRNCQSKFADDHNKPESRRSSSSCQSLSMHGPPSLTSTSPPVTSPMTRIRSWFKPKSYRPHTRSSIFTEDSGYYSGRATPCTTLMETPPPHPRSLMEFESLYRVACHNLHEPHSPNQFRDVLPCGVCLYSSIHNLGWCARHLSLVDFRAQLDRNAAYDVGAIDAAGNSALHYAAVGGAGYEYLKALVDSGVNPYQVNTAGQLFLHCLRPYMQGPDPKCFNLDLLKILNLVEPIFVFGQIDNDGRSILHTLASHLNEPELRAQAFKLFTDAGCSPSTPDRFGNGAKDIVPVTYQTLNSGDTFGAPKHDSDTINIQQELSEWELQQVKQIEAHNILSASFDYPRYVDPQSGDNVFHALSRLPSQKNDILSNLVNFIKKGANPNLHNFNGYHPLFSFISDRPSEDETGAAMCRYLDALLWRDSRHLINSNINVNMKNREGEIALHGAAVRARPDSVRSLIAAGANVNARSDNGISVLQATYNAKLAAVLRDDTISIHLLKEVISQLEYAGAVPDPTSLEERGSGRQTSPRLDTTAVGIAILDGPPTTMNAVHNPTSIPRDDTPQNANDTHEQP